MVVRVQEGQERLVEVAVVEVAEPVERGPVGVEKAFRSYDPDQRRTSNAGSQGESARNCCIDS